MNRELIYLITGHCKPRHTQVVPYLQTREIKVTAKHVYVKQKIEKLCARSKVYMELHKCIKNVAEHGF
jgi:hypothetical protein